jgi:hypothetical protein
MRMHGRILKAPRSLRCFWKETSGGVLIYTAFALPMLLAVAGLAVDLGLWYMNKRVTQATADSAAISSALEVMRLEDVGVYESDLLNIALASGGDNGYHPSGGDTMEVNYPPDNGPYAGNGDAVEVIVRRPTTAFLGRILFKEDVTVASRAVARVDINDTCVWALNRTTDKAVRISGSANVDLPCGILSNSNHPEAFSSDGAACVTASGIRVVGGSLGDCINPDPSLNMNAVNDPLNGMAPPAVGPCDFSSNIRVNTGDSVTLDPGVYCGRISVMSGGSLHFNEGLYILDTASLTFNSSATVTGTDVSFYITPESTQGDNIDVAANANVSLSAPGADGELPGVLFYQDRGSLPDITHSFTGQATMDLEGILYFPNQNLQIAGGSEFDPVTTMIIADTVNFTGNTTTGNLDGSVVRDNPAFVTVTLVE